VFASRIPADAYALAISAYTDAGIEFLNTHWLGRLATVGADGVPHLARYPRRRWARVRRQLAAR
jgi:hypothetical protein